MADPRRVSTRRAVLGYDQLKKLTKESGFQWPDLLIKDYQGIIQDFSFLSDETDSLELRVIANEEDIAQLKLDVADLQGRVDDLEYRVYKNVITTTDLTTGQFQIILCKNTSAINITLKPLPIDGDELSIIRTDGVVRLIGTVNKKSNLTLNVKGSGPKLVYDAAEATWWRI